MTPDDLDPEKACVGIAIADPNALLDMDLRGEDFTDPRCGALWDLVVEMDARREAITPATVLDASRRLPVRIDGTFIFDAYAARPLPALAAKYASIVANNAGLRRLREAAQRIDQLIRGGGDAYEIAEIVRGEVDHSHRRTARAHFIRDTLDETIDSFEQPTRAIPTPWPDLTRLLHGWRPGALYVVGARPSVGKTLIGLQIAVDLCKHGPVAFSSLEMPRREIETRVIAQLARVPLAKLEGVSEGVDKLTDAEWERISRARPAIADLDLSVDDRSAVMPLDVRSHARTLNRHGRLAAIVIDYLQLFGTPRGGERRSRQEVVAEHSAALKAMAKEFDCPVIALSQLNRASEARHDKRPQMSDLRESGAVEQDADVVMLLHAEDKPDNPAPDLDLLVAKNRHGLKGLVQLTRNGAFAIAEPRRWTPHQALPGGYLREAR